MDKTLTVSSKPPYSDGSVILMISEDVYLEKNMAYIIYGYIPNNILYCSISSNKDTIIIENPLFCIIMCKSKNIYEYYAKKLKEELKYDINYKWLYPNKDNNKFIVNCILQKNSELPTLYCKLYTSDIKCNDDKITKIIKTSNINEKNELSENVYKLSIKKTFRKMFKIHKEISVESSMLLGSDVLTFISEDITLEYDTYIAISSIDHSKTKCSRFSTINVIDIYGNIISSWITGNYKISNIKNKNGVTTNMLRCKTDKTVKVIENIYCHPTTLSAPNENNILKMQVYIVSDKTVSKNEKI